MEANEYSDLKWCLFVLFLLITHQDCVPRTLMEPSKEKTTVENFDKTDRGQNIVRAQLG